MATQHRSKKTSKANLHRHSSVPSPARQPGFETARPDFEYENLQRTIADPMSAAPSDILALQQTAGNQAVSGLLVQARLTVGAVNDRYEQEAEHVATRVTDAPTSDATAIVQRQAEEEELLQASASGPHPLAAEDGLEERLHAHQGTGDPLPDAVRLEMETHLGADLRSVRVHTDAEAGQLNRKLQAKAFTHGSDVYFSSGQYDPHSREGRRLLAHELTHTIQQQAVPSAATAHTAPSVQRMSEEEFMRGATERRKQMLLGVSARERSELLQFWPPNWTSQVLASLSKEERNRLGPEFNQRAPLNLGTKSVPGSPAPEGAPAPRDTDDQGVAGPQSQDDGPALLDAIDQSAPGPAVDDQVPVTQPAVQEADDQAPQEGAPASDDDADVLGDDGTAQVVGQALQGGAPTIPAPATPSPSRVTAKERALAKGAGETKFEKFVGHTGYEATGGLLTATSDLTGWGGDHYEKGSGEKKTLGTVSGITGIASGAMDTLSGGATLGRGIYETQRGARLARSRDYAARRLGKRALKSGTLGMAEGTLGMTAGISTVGSSAQGLHDVWTEKAGDPDANGPSGWGLAGGIAGSIGGGIGMAKSGWSMWHARQRSAKTKAYEQGLAGRNANLAGMSRRLRKRRGIGSRWKSKTAEIVKSGLGLGYGIAWATGSPLAQGILSLAGTVTGLAKAGIASREKKEAEKQGDPGADADQLLQLLQNGDADAKTFVTDVLGLDADELSDSDPEMAKQLIAAKLGS